MTVKVALVTGASSGIGDATARRLAQLGYIVYAVARRADRMAALKERGIRTEPADVTDDAALVALVDKIISETGRIDVLVNNAGYGSYGALEDVPIAAARRQFDVNVFGLARLTQLVLPHMRAQHDGYIVNISSVGGKILGTARQLVPRRQVRGRRSQRQPARRGRAVRHQGHRHRARRHPHRVGGHLRGQPGRGLGRHPLPGAGQVRQRHAAGHRQIPADLRASGRRRHHRQGRAEPAAPHPLRRGRRRPQHPVRAAGPHRPGLRPAHPHLIPRPGPVARLPGQGLAAVRPGT